MLTGVQSVPVVQAMTVAAPVAERYVVGRLKLRSGTYL
jgi:hypothetical protein